MQRGTFARSQPARPLGTHHGRGICSWRLSRKSKQEASGHPALANLSRYPTAFRNGTDGATAAVVSSEHKVANVPRNKQLSTSHHFPCHHLTTMHAKTLIFDLFTVQFLSNPGGLLLPLRIMSAWPSPPQQLRVHAARTVGSRLRAEMSREDEQHWELVPQHQRLKASNPEPPEQCRSKGEWEQFGPMLVVLRAM